ncbi:VolA/Pla-1 family phospholipase [Parashewanella tropica]|uniref:VolA/Pla-1 family phospholipase n=1 Tax=Parashewanella tropica TaxID=2547970 RepID=UPI00105A002A|nr:VolA/Pla-1 family phospholipase [Parashewanella tropica]
MKKLLLGTVIASALGLTACGDGSIDDIAKNPTPLIPQATLVFDPANSSVPLPNDLLFNGTTDGTLNVPGEGPGKYTNPQVALGALDGWSTTEPINIKVNLPTKNKNDEAVDLGISEASVKQAGAIRVFEATVGGVLSSDASCKSKPSLSACKVGSELQYGTDFTTAVSGNQISVVPLKPLKANQSYLYVVTTKVEDTEGRAIGPSTTYNALKLDVKTNPLGTDQQRTLQTVVNSYEAGVSKEVDPKSITYAGLYTTQSVANVFETAKAKMAADFQGYITELTAYQKAGNTPDATYLSGLSKKYPYAPTVVPGSVKQVMNGDAPATAADRLKITEPSLEKTILDNAIVYSAKLRLPIYSECSSVQCKERDAANNPTGFWKAAGDSPLAVLSAIKSGGLSQAKFAQQAVAQGLTPAQVAQVQTNPSLLVGKTFKLDNGSPVDSAQMLTKFNPLPAIRKDDQGNFEYETVDVQITIPKESDDVKMPTAGFPVTIAMHGISAVKEMALVYSGTYASKGVSTIAIDLPLHGGRSYREGNSGPYLVSATSPDSVKRLLPDSYQDFKGSATTFVNIGSPLTIRDNFRQGIMDELALRLALPVISQQLKGANSAWATNDAVKTVLDVNGVTAQGLSLGAMISADFSVYANSGIVNPATGKKLDTNPYAISGVSLVAPSGGLAASFAGSNTFGQTLYQALQSNPQFSKLVTDAAKAKNISKEDDPDAYEALQRQVYVGFIPQFGFAVQTIIDSIDPINYGAAMKAMNIPTHLIEIVGNGNDNPSDRVLPNRFNGLPISKDVTLPLKGFPLAGTEPLISAIGLKCVSKKGDIVDGKPVGVAGSGAVRFVKGAHSTLVNPSSEFNSTPNTDFLTVSLEMQSQVIAFAKSAHAGKPQIFINSGDDVIKPCE